MAIVLDQITTKLFLEATLTFDLNLGEKNTSENLLKYMQQKIKIKLS